MGKYIYCHNDFFVDVFFFVINKVSQAVINDENS